MWCRVKKQMMGVRQGLVLLHLWHSRLAEEGVLKEDLMGFRTQLESEECRNQMEAGLCRWLGEVEEGWTQTLQPR